MEICLFLAFFLHSVCFAKVRLPTFTCPTTTITYRVPRERPPDLIRSAFSYCLLGSWSSLLIFKHVSQTNSIASLQNLLLFQKILTEPCHVLYSLRGEDTTLRKMEPSPSPPGHSAFHILNRLSLTLDFTFANFHWFCLQNILLNHPLYVHRHCTHHPSPEIFPKTPNWSPGFLSPIHYSWCPWQRQAEYFVFPHTPCPTHSRKPRSGAAWPMNCPISTADLCSFPQGCCVISPLLMRFSTWWSLSLDVTCVTFRNMLPFPPCGSSSLWHCALPIVVVQ